MRYPFFRDETTIDAHFQNQQNQLNENGETGVTFISH